MKTISKMGTFQIEDDLELRQPQNIGQLQE